MRPGRVNYELKLIAYEMAEGLVSDRFGILLKHNKRSFDKYFRKLLKDSHEEYIHAVEVNEGLDFSDFKDTMTYYCDRFRVGFRLMYMIRVWETATGGVYEY